MRGHDIARAAEALVGTRFRLHGRDPATGLDCVGLVAAALGSRAPAGYGLRNSDIADALAFAASIGLTEVSGAFQPGDVLLVHAGPVQHHLLVVGTANNFIHAHAGLRRVVATPAPLASPVERHWRLKD